MPIDMTGTVRLRVSQLLKERGMTVADLAKKTGMSYNTVLALTRDASDRFDRGTIAKLCKALGVQPGDLIVYDPNDIQD